MQIIKDTISTICQQLYDVTIEVNLTRPDVQFGDYATNVALQLAKPLGKNPREVAQAIADKLQTDLGCVTEATVAGPGFINIRLIESALVDLSVTPLQQSLVGKEVVAEYSDPNPFKILHAGHLYTSIVGDSIALLLEAAGANVHRVNFGGDVGMHVAKTIYVITNRLQSGQDLDTIPEADRSEWLASAYIEGTLLYEDDETAKQAIVILNKKIYELHNKQDHESELAQTYWKTRQWSYDHFEDFYARIGGGFEKYYPESDTAAIGLAAVTEQIGTVFERSDGAVIFPGEKYGLHTRVFINSEGLPTYESKDVGLIIKKNQDYHFDTSIVVTGAEQAQYMTVVIKAIEQFEPELAARTTHLTHGMVKLAGGTKMSSRKGNILRAADVLDVAQEANLKITGNQDAQTTLAAVKYAFLKTRLGGDIVYDPNESVALEGNSGPYIQYAHARARSILRKAETIDAAITLRKLDGAERSLLLKLSEFNEVIEKSIAELLPHHICTYLYELAQIFNRFYEHSRVIGDEREQVRLKLVGMYADTLKKGLSYLNISAPDEM